MATEDSMAFTRIAAGLASAWLVAASQSATAQVALTNDAGLSYRLAQAEQLTPEQLLQRRRQMQQERQQQRQQQERQQIQQQRQQQQIQRQQERQQIQQQERQQQIQEQRARQQQ